VERIGAWGCVLIVVAAALLRFSGLDRLQPHQPEPDSFLVLQAELLREGRQPDIQQSEKGYYAYPLVLAHVLALVPAAEANSANVAEHVAVASSEYVRARWLVAALALLLVPVTWLLARRFVDPLAALLAALLVATSLLHLYFSQQARHHAPQASFALVALLAALQLRSRPTWRGYFVASAMAMLALGTLHSGWFALLPVLAAHSLRRRDAPRAPWWALAVPIAACAAAWFGFYPRSDALTEHGGAYDEGGHTLYLRDLDFSGFATSARILWESEPGLTVLAAIGALWILGGARAAWRAASEDRRRDLLVVLAYALPYAAALAAYKETCDRMLLPLVPFLALLGGVAASRAAATVSSALRPVLLASAVAVPVFGALRYATVRGAPDTVEQCSAWIESHVADARERILVSPGLTLPLASDAEALANVGKDHASRQRRWLRHQLDSGALSGARALAPIPGKLLVGADLAKATARLHAFLEESKPAWLVVEVSKYLRVNPLAAELQRWAQTHGSCAATFQGEQEVWRFEPPIDYQDVPHLFLRLSRATSFGPVIEIYRIER
jgi:hypothetical protein